MDQIDLSGKVAIITGASSGIGAETAFVFARFGAKLALVGRDEVRLLETVTKCLAINDVVPLWIPLDLAHEGVCETVVQRTIETYGRLDVLVNCAGKVAISYLSDQSMKVFDDLMNVNFRVPYHLSQLSLPHLIKTKGNIINIGSSMSKRTQKGMLGYTVAKAALQMFSRQAAFELAPLGVRINSISPGPTNTNIVANLIVHNPQLMDEINSVVKESSSYGKYLDPKEIALLICLTASDVFPSLNGSDILFDGAASMA
ncbi:uncharacterized oxidoreductase SSP0419-like [Helicoverpa zea]|uniref:uncharacterized oxidoreductase SSP0419-like n=1 Tax=Helicoverpa zea TaxID=7113 RepID=UPI001F57FA87|nr:uncharacterized oxidoreductase SSP0419-like [Helicoverpa zea]